MLGDSLLGVCEGSAQGLCSFVSFYSNCCWVFLFFFKLGNSRVLRCISDAVAESVEKHTVLKWRFCVWHFLGFICLFFWGVVVFVFRVFVVLGICFLGMCGVGFF